MDSCVCPKCGVKLEVADYGYNLECSECKCKINVFRENSFYLETKFGTIGVSLDIWKFFKTLISK